MGIFNIFRNDGSLTNADCLNRLVTKVSNFPATLNGKSQEGETTPFAASQRRKGNTTSQPLIQTAYPSWTGNPSTRG